MLCLMLMTLSFGDWPGWGGPEQNFHVESLRCAPWEPDALREVWRAPLGDGYSGLVSRDGRLWTMYRPWLDEKTVAGEEVVVGLDATTGDLDWEFRYDAPTYPKQETMGGKGPHATPLLLENSLVTVGYTGIVHSFDCESGEPVWSRNFVEEDGATPVPFGWAASPVLCEGRLILSAFGSEASYLAVDPQSGEVVWSTPPAPASYVTPVTMIHEGKEWIVTVTGNDTWVIDPMDGTIVASLAHRRVGQTNFAMVVPLENGEFLVAGQGAQGARLLAFQRAETGWTLKARWHQRKLGFAHGSIVRNGDVVFGSTGVTFLAVAWREGKILWRTRGYPEANALALNGQLLMLAEDGVLSLAPMTPDGLEAVASQRLSKDRCWTAPVLVGDRLYLRDRHEITAWALPVAEEIPTSPLRVDASRVAVETDPGLLAFAVGTYRLEDGKEIVIRAKEGQLQRVESAETMIPLEPIQDLRFQAGETIYEFTLDEDGALTALKLIEGTKEEIGDKLRVEAKPVPDLIAAQIQGEYALDGEVIRILVEEERLILRATMYGKFSFALVHEGEGVFSVNPINVPFGVPPTKVRTAKAGAALQVLRMSDVVEATRR